MPALPRPGRAPPAARPRPPSTHIRRHCHPSRFPGAGVGGGDGARRRREEAKGAGTARVKGARPRIVFSHNNELSLGQGAGGGAPLHPLPRPAASRGPNLGQSGVAAGRAGAGQGARTGQKNGASLPADRARLGFSSEREGSRMAVPVPPPSPRRPHRPPSPLPTTYWQTRGRRISSWWRGVCGRGCGRGEERGAGREFFLGGARAPSPHP